MKKGILLLIPAFVLLLPAIARADGIALEALLLVGFIVYVPIMLFIVPVEALIISKWLKTSFRQTIKFAFWANILSTISGIFVLPFGQRFFETSKPQELYPYFRYYLPLSVLIYLMYFILTCIVEFFYGLRWRRKSNLVFSTKSLAWAVIWANIATYVILAPLHYWVSYPKTNIQKYTPDTEWARKPPVPVIYIDEKTKNLMQINTDGKNKLLLIPFQIKDYLVSADLNTFVFTGLDEKLYWYRKSIGKRIKIADDGPQSMMAVDLSPSGENVAFITGLSVSCIFEITEGGKEKVIPVSTSPASYSALAWSKEERVLYFWEKDDRGKDHLDKFKRITITDNLKFSIENVKYENIELCQNYGQFSLDLFGFDDWHNRRRRFDEYGDLKVKGFEWYGPTRFLSITRKGKEILFFTDNPGLIHTRLYGSDPSFVQNGQECIFELHGSKIYLIDINSRTLGKITDGYDHVVLTDSYTKKRFFENLKRKKLDE